MKIGEMETKIHIVQLLLSSITGQICQIVHLSLNFIYIGHLFIEGGTLNGKRKNVI